MKYFVDGDQIAVTFDDFIDLQKSPAVFIPRDSEQGRCVECGSLLALPMGDVWRIRELLFDGGGLLFQAEDEP